MTCAMVLGMISHTTGIYQEKMGLPKAPLQYCAYCHGLHAAPKCCPNCGAPIEERIQQGGLLLSATGNETHDLKVGEVSHKR